VPAAGPVRRGGGHARGRLAHRAPGRRERCSSLSGPLPQPTPPNPIRTPHPPPSTPPQLTMRALLPWARDNLLQDRPELFMKGDSV
jgi:hypothetical protein